MSELPNGEEEWSRQKTKLLVSTRLRMNPEFQEGKRSNKTLWRVVRREILDIESSFPFSSEDMSKKFQNLFTSYKRIKKRNSETGREATSWEYFEQFDEVFGSKHFLEPPRTNLLDTTATTQNSVPEDLENCESQSSNSVPVTNERPTKKRRIQYPKGDIIEELRRQDDNEEKRHKEFVELEREKLNIEKEKLQISRELKNIFLQMNNS